MSMITPSKALNYWLSLPFMACFEGNYNERAIKQNVNPQANWAMADPLLLGVCMSLSPCFPVWAGILIGLSDPSLLLDPSIRSLATMSGRAGKGEEGSVMLSWSLHACWELRCCCSPTVVSSKLLVFFFFFLTFSSFSFPSSHGSWSLKRVLV